MAYVFAGLGIALVIPLMALMQSLLSIDGLQRAQSSQRLVELALTHAALDSFHESLVQGINSNVIIDDPDVMNQFVSCSDLPSRPPGQSPPPVDLPGLSTVQAALTLKGNYPNCDAILLQDNSSTFFRVEMAVKAVRSSSTGNLGLPEFGAKIPHADLERSLRVLRTCWVQSEIEECN